MQCRVATFNFKRLGQAFQTGPKDIARVVPHLTTCRPGGQPVDVVFLQEVHNPLAADAAALFVAMLAAGYRAVVSPLPEMGEHGVIFVRDAWGTFVRVPTQVGVGAVIGPGQVQTRGKFLDVPGFSGLVPGVGRLRRPFTALIRLKVASRQPGLLHVLAVNTHLIPSNPVQARNQLQAVLQAVAARVGYVQWRLPHWQPEAQAVRACPSRHHVCASAWLCVCVAVRLRGCACLGCVCGCVCAWLMGFVVRGGVHSSLCRLCGRGRALALGFLRAGCWTSGWRCREFIPPSSSVWWLAT